MLAMLIMTAILIVLTVALGVYGLVWRCAAIRDALARARQHADPAAYELGSAHARAAGVTGGCGAAFGV